MEWSGYPVKPEINQRLPKAGSGKIIRKTGEKYSCR
jgi:hypothetical protein